MSIVQFRLSYIFTALLMGSVVFSAQAQLTPLVIGDIPPGDSLIITFDVVLDDPLPAGLDSIAVQGTVSGSNFANVPTDDPDTPAADDSTKTKVVPNLPPMRDALIADLLVDEDAADVLDHADLNTIFSDPDAGDALTFSVQSESTPGLVTVSIDGADSTLDLTAFTGHGMSTVVIEAQDSYGAAVSDTFIVTVNGRPDLVSPIADVNAEQGAPDLNDYADLNAVFSDPESEDLTFVILSQTNNSSVVVSIDGSEFLDLTDFSMGGIDTIVVQAADPRAITETDTIFVSINAAPVASAAAISYNSLTAPDTLRASYLYSDNDGDLQGASLYAWLRSSDPVWAGATPIAGATDTSYVLTVADHGMYLAFVVTPVAQTGATPGLPDTSAYVGEIQADQVQTDLSESWSWISRNVTLQFSTNPEDLFQGPPYGPLCVDFAQTLGDVWIPGVPGGLTDWTIDEGLIVHTTCVTSWNLVGDRIATDTPIVLETGWNLIPYYPPFSLSATDALFPSLGTDLLIAIGRDGQYLPTIFDGLTMSAGKAYLLYMFSPATLTYPAVAPTVPPGTDAPTISFDTAISGDSYVTTDRYHSLVFTDVGGDWPLQIGDEVLAYADLNGDLICIGGTIWNGESALSISAWRDDPLTEVKDGYTAGEPIHLKTYSAQDGQLYTLDVSFADDAGVYEATPVTFITTATLSVEDPKPAVHRNRLAQNLPNPFNPSTTIGYELASAQHVRLHIYDGAGRLIKTLVDQAQESGFHDVTWTGQNENGVSVSSGVYFYRIETNVFSQTKRMIFLK